MPNPRVHPSTSFAAILAAALAFVLFFSATALHAQRVDAYIVVDDFTKKILAEHNANDKRPVASLVKMATAMVTLDWAEATGFDLNTLAVVPLSAAEHGGANPMGLMPGDRISLRNCLYAALLVSDNSAAETLAAFVGTDLLNKAGQTGNPIAYFIDQMNALAATLGMARTSFTNPHGLDHMRKPPVSTAADVARLALYAASKGSYMFYAAQKERDVSFFRGEEEKHFIVKTTNTLLGVDGIDGLKTGLTKSAGPCLAITAPEPNLVAEQPDGTAIITPRRIVVVVLGAEDRFGSARTLLLRGREQYAAWREAGRVLKSREELLTYF